MKQCYFAKEINTQIYSTYGTYDRSSNYDEIMNMGLYDVTNETHVNLESFEKAGKNNEIRAIKK